MLRLWEVSGVPFEDKKEAKVYRDEHGGVVSKGKDHKDFGVKHGNSIHPKKGGSFKKGKKK